MRRFRISNPINVAVAAARPVVSVEAILYAIAFATLIAFGAQVRIPFPGSDVPYTLQSLAVLVTGLTLAPSAAAAATILYLACGVAGLPVFTPGSAGLFGATGGYLFGFAFAALTISLVRGPSTSTVRLIVAGSTGLVVLFACGLAWRYVYAIIFGLDAGALLATGVVPFIPKAIVELLLAVALTKVGNQYRDQTEPCP
jgi:biotin transport system substrate-specific component